MDKYKQLLLVTLLFFPLALTHALERVSVDNVGNQANGTSARATISADGRFVVFESTASNLVANDTNGLADIFVHNRQTGVTERVSVGAMGIQGNGISNEPSISADGRFVVFISAANNLVANDTNGMADVFMHDRQTGVTERVSVSGTNAQANNLSQYPSISADGRFVVFESIANNLVANDTNNVEDIFIRDRVAGTTERISEGAMATQADDSSYIPVISADGHFVNYWSFASNLVANDTNSAADAFLYNRQTGVTERVSVGNMGIEANDSSFLASISADGRFVAFMSLASNLVAGDINGVEDIFIHDRQTGETKLVSVNNAGVQGNDYSLSPSISADGRFIAFMSNASNLLADDTNGAEDIFVYGSSIRAAGTDSIPTMSASLLITLIGLVGGMALLVRGRSSRSA